MNRRFTISAIALGAIILGLLFPNRIRAQNPNLGEIKQDRQIAQQTQTTPRFPDVVYVPTPQPVVKAMLKIVSDN
jgi:hypothetical protein